MHGVSGDFSGDDDTFGEENLEWIFGEDTYRCAVDRDGFDLSIGNDSFEGEISAGEFFRMVLEHEDREKVSVVDGQGKCLLVEETKDVMRFVRRSSHCREDGGR